MARRWKLTWLKGTGRNGRWRKIHLGRFYYFDGGHGKTDDEAYARAIQSWESLKVQLDAEAETDKPYRAAYEAAINDWEAALAWARDLGNEEIRAAAAAKIGELRERLAQRNPPPLTSRDRTTRRDQLAGSRLLDRVAQELQGDSPQVSEQDVEDICERLGISCADFPEGKLGSVLSQLLRTSVWKDRLRLQKQKSGVVAVEQSVGHHVTEYVTIRSRSGITAGAADNIRRRLELFRDFVGTSKPVTEIGARTLDQFHGHLIEQIGTGLFTAETGKGTLQSIRAWLRWLWQNELIAELPRNINCPSHRIRPELKPIQTLTVAQIKQLYAAAKPNVRLYMLLALNCGMTQIDISDLRPVQVDFAQGTLSRKRGKTKHVSGVPTVTYPLWPETSRLLKQHRVDDGDRLLLAPGGGPLKFEERREKTSKHDFIGLTFRRLAKSLEIEAPFKSLKKTSASLLRNEASYIGLEGLFLDHAPQRFGPALCRSAGRIICPGCELASAAICGLTPSLPPGRPRKPRQSEDA